MSPLFTWIIFASVGIEMALGLLLLVGRAQYDRKYPAYRSARLMYALMFFQFSLETLILNTIEFQSYIDRVSVLIVMFSVVTILLSTSLITFIEPKFFTRSLLVKEFVTVFMISALCAISFFAESSVSTSTVALVLAVLAFIVLSTSTTVAFLKNFLKPLRLAKASGAKTEKKILSMLFASGVVVIMMGPGAFLVPFMPESVNLVYYFGLVVGVVFCYFAYDSFSRNISSVYELSLSAADENGGKTYLDPVEEDAAETDAPRVRTSFKKVCSRLDEWNEKKGYLEAGITTDILAERFATSRKYISRYFNEVAQMSFRDYVNTNRVEEAKRLMHTTSLDDNDISRVIGFTSRAQFVGLFKTITGVTPSVWRKSN